MTPEEEFVAREMARADLYFFARYMFLKRRSFKWQRAPHHKIICSALLDVYYGRTKRLIINIPPRYSKTELAVVNFISWALGRNPDAEFIHSSYSSRLASTNAWQARELVTHEAYQKIVPELALRQDSKARDEWRTTAGGCVYACGAGGTITGYGAGKMRDEFGGCFPVGTRVWTEHGLVPIDRIVRERMDLRVWAYDGKGRMVLRPITAWHENPPNDIVKISFDDGASVECTPDHRFWTARGWVRADLLCVDDQLPCINSGVKGCDNVSINPEKFSRWSNAESILTGKVEASIGNGDFGLFSTQDCTQIGSNASIRDNGFSSGDRFPCVASPDLVNDSGTDAVGFGEFFSRDADSIVNSERLAMSYLRLLRRLFLGSSSGSWQISALPGLGPTKASRTRL